MKKNKLSLENLEVKSFVTSLNGSNSETIKGGLSLEGSDCNNDPTYVGPTVASACINTACKCTKVYCSKTDDPIDCPGSGGTSDNGGVAASIGPCGTVQNC